MSPSFKKIHLFILFQFLYFKNGIFVQLVSFLMKKGCEVSEGIYFKSWLLSLTTKQLSQFISMSRNISFTLASRVKTLPYVWISLVWHIIMPFSFGTINIMPFSICPLHIDWISCCVASKMTPNHKNKRWHKIKTIEFVSLAYIYSPCGQTVFVTSLIINCP